MLKSNLFFVCPLSGPNNGVKIISSLINKQFIEDGISVVSIDSSQAKNYSNFGRFSLVKIFSIFKIIKKLWKVQKIDSVYINLTPNGFAYYRDLFIIWFCLKRTSNITCHIHANGLENRINKLNIKLFQKLKIIIINSHQLGELSKFKLNLFLLRNALPDTSQLETKRATATGRLRLVFLSNLSIEKGVGKIKELAGLINKKKSLKIELNVYGGALTEKDRVSINEVSKKFDFVNYYGPILENNEKIKKLKENDVLLLLSKPNYEVFPLVYIEALMCGLPIISTRQYVFEDIGSQEFLKELDYDLSNLDEVIEEVKLTLKVKSKQARKFYLNYFSFENFIENLKKIIFEVS